MSARIRAAFLSVLLAPACFGAANVIVFNGDGPGEGFNDPTPAAPVGGNPGTTIGQQRQIVYLFAAQIWGATLTSSQTIRVLAFFDALSCSATGGVLGAAAPFTSYVTSAQVGNLPPNVWHPAALAEKLANVDIGAILLPPGNNFEAFSFFNSAIGQPNCLPGGWYYGIDNNPPPGRINLAAVVLHELGHGMGFTVGPTSAQTGVRAAAGPNRFPAVWEQHMLDVTTGKRWLNMTNAERAASAINTNSLVWAGNQTTVDYPQVLGFRSELDINGPNSVRGTYEANPATFGPPLTQTGLKDILMPAVDGGVSPIDGCEPFSTQGNQSVRGRIALVDRGNCAFVQKVKNAQNAGATGVVIANTAPVGPSPMGGTDPTIVIPSIGITRALGQALRALPQLNNPGRGGLPVTMQLSSTIRAGVTAGWVRLYAPNPFEGGSSVSHWDISLNPSVLMEPAITAGLALQLTPPRDLTFSLMRDIGW